MSNVVQDIDFVLIWVDGSDLQWQKTKAQYRGDEHFNQNNVRYRDWDILHYWFRGVEKFAPWVRKVHFVTCGHVPQWLQLEHPKLNFVTHEQYIAGEFLPTFSANPIELNLHRIEGLAEQFVFFNDDMFLTAPVTPEDFFVNGFPRGYGVLNPPTADRNGIAGIILNDIGVIVDHFDFKTQFRAHIAKWMNPIYGTYNIRNLLLLPWRRYVGFLDLHLPSSFLKSTFQEVWAKEEKLLREVSSHKFRSNSDVNQWLMSYWQVASGNFAPGNPKIGKAYYVTSDADAETVSEAIRTQRWKMVCVNDSEKIVDIAPLRDKVAAAFDVILPEKSGFEK